MAHVIPDKENPGCLDSRPQEEEEEEEETHMEVYLKHYQEYLEEFVNYLTFLHEQGRRDEYKTAYQLFTQENSVFSREYHEYYETLQT